MPSLKCSALGIATLLFAHISLAETVVSGTANVLAINTDVTNIENIEITGPNEFHLQTKSLALTSKEGFANGQYRFEVKANTGIANNLSTTENGRDGSVTTGTIVSVVDTGYFIIYNGAVVDVTTEPK